MAEALGVVCSVIGIATIITTGTKLSGVLKDMRHTPDEIFARLEQLHILSFCLQEQSEVVSFPPLHVQHVRQQCRACLFELANMLGELTDSLERSGRFRKKFFLARHVLRKDQIAKIELRLSHSVDLLAVASQLYTMFVRLDSKVCFGTRHAETRI